MDLTRLPAILWRWRWVMLSVVVVTIVAAVLHLRRATPVYRASVRIQLTAPQDADISLLDVGNPSTSTLRDDLTLTQNNFETVVQSGTVRSRTVERLGLDGGEAAYGVTISPVPDSNFVDLVVSARTANVARSIADVHAAQAIRYYGELRAKPAGDTKKLVAEQLQSARAALESAAAPKSSESATAEVDVARSTYQFLLKKYADASLAAENAARVTYIQIAEPATLPLAPAARGLATFIGFSLVGALGLCVLLALLLESLFTHTRRAPVAIAFVDQFTRDSADGDRRHVAGGRAWAPNLRLSYHFRWRARQGSSTIIGSPMGGGADD